jgi:hypothetical protein
MMRNMDNFWVVSVEREAFGWRYSASRQGVVWAQGWFRSDTGEDEAFQMAWRIGKQVFHDANGQEISDRLLVYAKTVAATLGEDVITAVRLMNARPVSVASEIGCLAIEVAAWCDRYES